MATTWSRRGFLQRATVAAVGVIASACQPKVVEKVVEKEVTKVVKEVVKETVIVEGTPQVVEKVVEKQVTAAPAPQETIVLHPSTFMGPDEGYMEPRSKDFETMNPHIKVEPLLFPRAEYTTKILALAAANQTPDIVWGAIAGGTYINLALKGIVIPLDDLADAHSTDFYEEWIKAAIDVGSWGGKRYALPNMCHPGSVSLYVNKGVFDEAGIPYPTLDTSLEEAMEMAQKASIPEGREKRYGYAVNMGYVNLNPQMRTWGAEFLSPDGKECLLDSPEGIACAQWIQDMLWKDRIHPTTSELEGTDLRKMFAAGKIAMMVSTLAYASWAEEQIQGAFTWDVTLIPKKRDVNVRGSCIACHHLGITKDCKHLDEAWDLLYFFCNHDTGVLKALNGWGDPGARHDCWGDPLVQAKHPAYVDHYEVLKNCAMHILPWNCHGPEMMDAIANNMASIWNNEVSAEEGMKATATALRDVLAKAPIGS